MPTLSFGTKIKQALSSVRFWYCVVVSIAYLLDITEVLPGAYAKTIEVFGILGITIRTVDKFSV